MSGRFYKVIDVPFSDTKNGVLSMFQSGSGASGSIPFTIRRVLATSGMKEGQTRGGHTHHKTNQVLVCIHGACTVDLDNGTRKESIRLDKPHRGLLLYPYVWHVMRDFTPEAVLMVLANTKYDEKDYIRSYDEFLACVKKKA